MRKKLTNKQLKELITPKVPVEIALEDLMNHLVKKKKVAKFSYSTKDGNFALIWEEKGEKKYISLTSQSDKEKKAIKSLLISYVKQFNKELKEKV